MNVMTENPWHKLTIGQRHVLRTLLQARWNYKTAAERLQVPEATVRTTVHRAIARAKVEDRSDLAYWMGREDEHNL